MRLRRRRTRACITPLVLCYFESMNFSVPRTCASCIQDGLLPVRLIGPFTRV